MIICHLSIVPAPASLAKVIPLEVVKPFVLDMNAWRIWPPW